MKDSTNTQPCPVLYFSHGGGPLPLLGDEGHQEMVDFLKQIRPELGNPSAILLISAHWEESVPTLTSATSPGIIYDYYGFPPESYEIKYPAPGDPGLAGTVQKMLADHGISATLDSKRGFDHGMFVPLKILYPEATIPCIQLSLVNSLNADEHIQIGKALSKIREQNVLVFGSGFSYHNIRAFFAESDDHQDPRNDEFQQWLIETCTTGTISEQERETQLIHWDQAPFARYCHPREEHLLPLHVCYGICGSQAELKFDGHIMNKKAAAFLWT